MKAPKVIVRLVTTNKGEFVLTELKFPYDHTITYVSNEKEFEKPVTVFNSVYPRLKKPLSFIYRDDKGHVYLFGSGRVLNVIEL